MKVPGFPQRDWLPDQLKGWAVIWMILVHTVELFLQPAHWDHPIAQWAFFMGAIPAAPVFMLLMGYYGLRRDKPVKFVIIRGLKLILWGLLLNAGLNGSLLIRWIGGHADVNILHYLFGIDILILAGLALILSGIIDLLKLRWYAWWLLALLPPLAAGLNLFPLDQDSTTSPIHWSLYLTTAFTGSATWSFFPVIPWISYVFAGIGISRLFQLWPDFQRKKRYLFYVSIPSALIFLAGLVPAWKVTQNLQQYYHHGLLFFLWALSMILLLVILMLASVKPQTGNAGRWIRFLGARVTSSYVIQWLIIGNLGSWLYQSLSIPQTLLLFVVILLVTIYLSNVYYKIRSR